MSRKSLLFAALMGLAFIVPEKLHAQDFGVFMKVADVQSGTVTEISHRMATVVEEAGWTLLTAYDAGVDAEACSYQVRILVADWPEHTRLAMSRGNHGAFAAPFRIAVFEDEQGVHVATVNPRSINRTVVAEEGMEGEWVRLSAILRRTLAEGIGETPIIGDFGQFRDKGRIGKTMGVMAGGPFLEKIKEIQTVDAGEAGAEGVAQAVYDAMAAGEPGADWGVRPAYVMNPAPGVAVLGVTGERMEARSFSIVGRGSDKSRSDFACPGLDHAAAYPIEVVFIQDGDSVGIHMVDAMFRMKMFFEDAGKLKFARNMGMPGSIEDEIRELIQAALF